jgi:hypothetical protein
MAFKIIAIAVLAFATFGLGSPALASQKVSEEMQQKIRAHLTEQGYEVRKIKREDGLFEAYALKDGQRLEIYLNSDMTVVRTKVDD